MIPVYSILGVSPTATDEELENAYKKLARQYHPDKCGGDDSKMSQINEAYHLIDTPEKRRKYDESNAFTAEYDMLASVFGRTTVAKNFGKKPTVKPAMKHGTDIALTVNIPLSAFIVSSMFNVKFTRKCECLECDGTGAKSHYTCTQCGGYGSISIKGRKRKCTKCGGTGYVIKEKCPVCGGNSVTTKEIELPIMFKAMTTSMTVPYEGNNGVHGGENGNLNITFNVKPCDGFSYDASDGTIVGNIKLYPEDLVLGASVGVKIGNRAIGLGITPADAAHIPIKVASNGIKFKLDVDLISPAPDDEKLYYALRNNHINDII